MVRRTRSVGTFLALMWALSVPFWVLGALLGEEGRQRMPFNLPVAALQFVSPALAAVILTWREDGAAGVRALLARVVDGGRVTDRRWWLPAFLLLPAIYTLAYATMRAADAPLPDDVRVPWSALPLTFALFWLTGALEELGWTAYATDPLQARQGALRAALILGATWQLLHVVPDVQNGRAAGWIASQRLAGVALRVLLVWLYNGARRSVAATTVMHATDNVGAALFPNGGSHYDPFYVMVHIVLAAALVPLGSGRSKARR